MSDHIVEFAEVSVRQVAHVTDAELEIVQRERAGEFLAGRDGARGVVDADDSGIRQTVGDPERIGSHSASELEHARAARCGRLEAVQIRHCGELIRVAWMMWITRVRDRVVGIGLGHEDERYPRPATLLPERRAPPIRAIRARI